MRKDVFSPTVDAVAKIARKMVLDKGQLFTFVIDLAAAKEDGRIHFDNAEDEATFHGLMAGCLIQMIERK